MGTCPFLYSCHLHSGLNWPSICRAAACMTLNILHPCAEQAQGDKVHVQAARRPADGAVSEHRGCRRRMPDLPQGPWVRCRTHLTTFIAVGMHSSLHCSCINPASSTEISFNDCHHLQVAKQLPGAQAAAGRLAACAAAHHSRGRGASGRGVW